MRAPAAAPRQFWTPPASRREAGTRCYRPGGARARSSPRHGRSGAAAVVTLIAVTAFEVSAGFHLLSNVYDAVDRLANAAGVGFGVAVDVLSMRPVGSEDSPASGRSA